MVQLLDEEIIFIYMIIVIKIIKIMIIQVIVMKQKERNMHWQEENIFMQNIMKYIKQNQNKK